jgi:type 1 glutamine amidotransferase
MPNSLRRLNPVATVCRYFPFHFMQLDLKKVLPTLSPSNYPLGLKNVVAGGDLPVVWTNTRYRMLYMNMGHGDRIFTSDLQNRLLEDAILWVGATKP